MKFYSVIKSIVFNTPTIHLKNEINSNCECIININGSDLECWLAKTFINSVIFTIINFKSKYTPLGPHAHSIIEALYSGGKFKSPFGLYFRIRPNNFAPNDIGYFNPESMLVELIKAETKIVTKHEFPLYFHCNFVGIELIGFYNITELSDENALEGPLKPAHEMLIRDKWLYKPEKFLIQSAKGPTHTKEDTNKKYIFEFEYK